MISSVPYVPPDTIKKVAATRGQSVSFATLFLVVGITREGYCAGSDNELNSYFRPPERSSLSRCGGASSQLQNTRAVSACKRKMRVRQNFFQFADRTFVLALQHSFPTSAMDWPAARVDRKRSC